MKFSEPKNNVIKTAEIKIIRVNRRPKKNIIGRIKKKAATTSSQIKIVVIFSNTLAKTLKQNLEQKQLNGYSFHLLQQRISFRIQQYKSHNQF